MQKRLKLSEPHEANLRANVATLKGKIRRKLRKYSAPNGDKKKLRKYMRDYWVMEGFYEQQYEFTIILSLHERFVALDLVPTHFHYPELYNL